MHEKEAVLPMDEGEPRDPVAKIIGIRCGQHRNKGVAAAGGDHTFALRQQVQVVISEHADDRIPVPVRPAQHAEGVRPPVDQIAREPQPVTFGAELDSVQKPPESAKTSLHIADDPGCHSAGMLMR